MVLFYFIEILQDVKEECSKYGSVVNVVVPRPIEGVQNSAVGKVCISVVSFSYFFLN